MLDHRRIEALARIGNREHLITSVYLNIDRTKPHPELKAIWKDLLRQQRQHADQQKIELTHRQKTELESDLAHIERFILNEFVHKDFSKGLVIFACAPLKLWEILELPQPVPDLLVCDYDTYIRPLSELVSAHRRHMIILVDSKKAKIIDVALGFARVHLAIDDEIQPKVKFGGMDGVKERNIDRAHEEMVTKHLKKVAQEAKSLFDAKFFNWIIIGGRQALLNQFRPFLPYDMHKKLIGQIVVEPEAPLNAILKKSEEITRLALDKHEADMIARLKSETHAKSGKGIFGLQPTLHSLRRGSVDTLIITRGFRSAGIKCLSCSFIGTPEETSNDHQCPVCSSPVYPVRDVIEDAITYAYKNGCKVDNVNENSRLKMMGNVGAILRF